MVVASLGQCLLGIETVVEWNFGLEVVVDFLFGASVVGLFDQVY